MAWLILSFLGNWRASVDGEPVKGFESGKVRALLTYLVVEADRPHFRETLAGLLWPDLSQNASLANLRQALANLRKSIRDASAQPPFLLITRETIQFNGAGDYALDIGRFNGLLAACEQHPHRHIETCDVCATRLQRAVNLYRGDFLKGFFLSGNSEFEEWVLIWRERLQQSILGALAHLAEYYERRGSFELAKQMLARQIELDPWREESHRHLMRVLAYSGQRSAALAQYKACRRVLAEELGVEPTAETTALYQEIKTGELEKKRAGERPPLFNWPYSDTPLIGRETEMAELAELITNPDCRLLTLLGPGGMGKTHLALEAARAHAWKFAHGAAFVSLAPRDSVDDLVPTIAHALGVMLSASRDPREQLIQALREHEMLIVLDNFEHLRASTALLTDILARAPGVQFMITSRERLGTRSEWVFELGGLSYPRKESNDTAAEKYSAVQLFLHHAHRTHSAFAPAETDRVTIAHICRMLAGLPLAIELAAAWTRVLTCAEILAEIKKGLDILSTKHQDVSERRRSLRTVFDSSWELLTLEEQKAARNLSVFRGGFDREAAEHVAAVTLELLSMLVDKSLLRWDHTQRYDMHELIGQYAYEKLQVSGDEDTIRERHAKYFLSLVESAEPELWGPQQRTWLKRLEVELNNLRAALDWTMMGSSSCNSDSGLRQVTALERFWWMRGMSEGRAWLATLLQQAKETKYSFVHARALDLAGDLAMEQDGDFTTARLLYEESLSIQRELGDKQGEAASLLGLGTTAYAQGDLTMARSLLERSLAMWRELGQKSGMSRVLPYLGFLVLSQGDAGLARSLFTECLEIERELGDESGIAWAFDMLGEVARYLGDYEQSQALYEESLRLHRQLDSKWGIAALLSNIGYVALNQGNDKFAKMLFEESLSLSRELRHKGMSMLGLIGMAGLEKQPRIAARLLGAVGPFSQFSPADEADYDRIVASVRNQLHEPTFAAAWEAGRLMTLNQAIELALREEQDGDFGRASVICDEDMLRSENP